MCKRKVQAAVWRAQAIPLLRSRQLRPTAHPSFMTPSLPHPFIKNASWQTDYGATGQTVPRCQHIFKACTKILSDDLIEAV